MHPWKINTSHAIVTKLLPAGHNLSGIESESCVGLEQIFWNHSWATWLIGFLLFVVGIVAILRLQFVNQGIDVFVFFLVVLILEIVPGLGLLVDVIMFLVIHLSRSVGPFYVILLMLATMVVSFSFIGQRNSRARIITSAITVVD